MKIKIYITFTLIFTNLFAFSQDKISFEHISMKDGLSQSSVSSILQDYQGFIWFGTADGLNRFDGYEIEVLKNTSDSSSIPNNTINYLFEDHNKKLWIGISKTGLAVYDKVTEKFLLYKNIENDSTTLTDNNIQTICQDKNNNLWIATSSGLNKFDYQTKTVTQFYTKNGLLHNQINNITIHGNILWIATSGGINYLNIDNQIIKSINSDNSQLINNQVNYLYVDKQDLLWIGTKKGLQYFDLKQFNYDDKIPQFTTFLSENSSNSISDNEIKCILQDKEGLIWIGTNNGGLNRYNKITGKFTIFKNNPFDLNSLSINSIMSLYEDESGILWIGTSLGGVNKFNRLAKAFTTYQKSPFDENSLSSDRVRSIYEDKEGNIWFGTVYGGITSWNQETDIFTHYKHNPKNPKSLNDDYVRTIMQDSDGTFWIGTDTAGIAEFDPKTGNCIHYKHDLKNPQSIPFNRVWKIFQDSKSRIWVCTFDGLSLFDKNNKTFKTYKNNPDDEFSISDNQVTTIFEDKSGNLWVGTWTGGLNRFDAENDKFYRYKQNYPDENFTDRVYCIIQDSDGILWTANKETFNRYDVEKDSLITYKTSDYDFKNGVLMSFIEDSERNFWITTNDGLVKMNKDNFYIKTYFDSDGLQSNEFMVNAFCKTSKGQILIGGINGVNAFYPEKIEDNNHIPKIAITSFKVLNKEFVLDTSILLKKNIILSYKDNEFSFEFVALDYSYSAKNQYSYMLEGYDEEMINCENRRFASYTNLDPGKYTFRVIGSNNDGIWNYEGIKLSIQITAPFWQKPWFFVVMFLIAIALIYSILKYRDITRDKRQLEVQVQKRTEKIIQQKEEIVSQMEQIENQKNKLEQAYKNVKLLSEIGQEITSHLSLEKIIDTVNKTVHNLMEVDIFGIGIYHDEKEKLEFYNIKIGKKIIPKLNISVNDKKTIAAWCFVNKSEIFISDLQKEYSKYLDMEEPPKIGEDYAASIIYFPLISQNQCRGVLTVQKYEKEQYTNYHINIIRNLAVYTSIAFENSNAFYQIEHQKKGITDSIFYASRIQNAVLTPKIFLEAIFKEYFILNRPRDIVSGDFYWVKNLKINNNNLIIIAVADCTGHGVPGAFMSMLGISILNELAAYHKNIQKVAACEILNELRDTVIKSLHQTGKIGESQDGMDIALCIIDHENMKLDFAGANNPMYLVRKQKNTNENENQEEYELIEKLPDRMPIGFFLGNEKNFSSKMLDIEVDDKIYLFSDGFIDQFGGNVGKKYLSKNFKRLILSIQNNSFEKQKELLEENLTDWMSHKNKQGKTYQQIDDILVFGVKI